MPMVITVQSFCVLLRYLLAISYKVAVSLYIWVITCRCQMQSDDTTANYLSISLNGLLSCGCSFGQSKNYNDWIIIIGDSSNCMMDFVFLYWCTFAYLKVGEYKMELNTRSYSSLLRCGNCCPFRHQYLARIFEAS